MEQTKSGNGRVNHHLKTGLFLLLFIIPISVASVVMLDRIKNQLQESVRENLESVLQTTSTAINSWLDETIEQVRLETRDEQVQSLIGRLLDLQAAGGDLTKDPAQAALRDDLKPWMEKNEMTGFFVFTPSGINIASTWEQNIGLLTPVINQGESYARAVTGVPQLVLPYRSEVPVPNINGELRVGEPTMDILVPVHDLSGSLIAIFGVRFDPSRRFSQIAHLPRSGQTGDSYFFNQYGKIITEGRFDDDLRKHGIIPPDSRSILTLRIANPGGNMMAGYQPDVSREEMPLTEMARSAISENSGYNVEGYRDYRGIPVVGAWTWDKKYEFGMTYEIDVSEAYRHYFTIRRIVIIGFFIILMPFLLLLYVSSMRERMARSVSEKLIQNEKKLRDVTDTVQDAIVMIGPEDRIKFWSLSAEKMFGFSREEALDRKLHQLIVPEHYRKEAYAGLDRFYVTGQGPIVGSLREVMAIRKDGSRFQGELSINRISMDDRWWAVGTVRDISERKQVEKALLLSEARLMEAQEIANLGHWELDLATQKLKLSSETYRIYGLDPKHPSISSSYFRSVVHPDDREAVNQAYADSMASGKEYNIDYRIVLKDGRTKYINERCKVEHNGEGQPSRFLGTILDITLLKVNEIELFRLSERFKLASQAAGIGVWDLDLQDNTVIWDDFMYELYEIDRDQFSGKESFWFSLVHPDDLPVVQEQTQRAIQGMGPLDTVFRISTANGGIKYIKVDAQVYQDDQGRTVRMIGINYDVTHRVKTEAELKALNEELEQRVKERTADLEKARIAALSIMQDANLQRDRAERALSELEQSQKKLAFSEGRFRGLVENTDDIIWEKDGDEGLYIYISPTVKEIVGFTQEEMMGRPAVSFITEEYAKAWKEVMRKARETDQPISGFEYAHRHKTKSQPVILEANVSLIYNHDHEVTGFRGVSRDITERKYSERELTLALERAETATRAKSEFLANMSHEIRTPMNAIIGMAYLALQTELTGKQADYLTKIQSSAQSLLGIINDILDFSKIEAGKLALESVDFNLAEVLDHLADLAVVKGMEKKDLKIVIDTDAQTPLNLVGDPLRLTQVLTNLVNNAIKFTDKGEVAITTRRLEKRGEKVTLEFSVRDTGIGLDESQIGQLFQAFSQVDASTTRKFGGTGLGLTISKNLVGMMGGDILVKSQLGKGSTFTFTAVFETAREGIFEKKNPEPQPVLRPSVRGRDLAAVKGARILLVEDNEINQQVAVEILEGAGLKVALAANGADAIETLDKGEYDAVLMDIQMPVMDGYQASREIRRRPRFKDLPIIAMTAHAMTGDREKSLEAGMNDHITKPIDRNELFTSLLKWIKHSQGIQGLPEAPPVDTENPADKTRPLEKVPGIEVMAGLDRVNNNQALYQKLLKRFQTEYADGAARVRALLEARNFKEAGQLIHTIKGLAGNLGAETLQEQAGNLESAVRGADFSGLDELTTAFEIALDIVNESIQTLVPDEALLDPPRHIEGDHDGSGLPELLEALAPHLRTGKLAPSRKIMNQIVTLSWPPKLNDDLNDLENMIQKFDFEQAESILNRIKERLKS